MSNDKKLTKTAYYPRNTTLHESLAMKVITRVVSDNVSLRNAVREAIKIAELNKKDIFLLLSVLQDFGMVQNGDFKNYWANGWGEGIGTEGIDSNQGTNFYASNNQKIVTADEKELFDLFEQVEKLRAFASDEEIISVNPELEEVITAMNKTEKIVTALDATGQANLEKPIQREVDIPETFFQKAFKKTVDLYKQKAQGGAKQPFEEIFFQVTNGSMPNINWAKMAPIIQKFIPDYSPLAHVEPKTASTKKANIWTNDAGDEFGDEDFSKELEDLENSFGVGNEDKKKTSDASLKDEVVFAQMFQQELTDVPAEAPTEAPAGGLDEVPEIPAEENAIEVEEPTEEGMDSGAGDAMNVEITPTPNELMELAKQGPAWEIQNMLSINKAEEYYNQLKKQLEEVAFNPNIKIDLNGIAKYDKVRNMIDAEINKIQDASKGKEKLEKKEEKLEQEIKQPEKEEFSVEEPVEKAQTEPANIAEAEPTAAKNL